MQVPLASDEHRLDQTGTSLSKGAHQRTGEFIVRGHAATRHAEPPGQRRPVNHRLCEIGERIGLGPALTAGSAGKLGPHHKVAAIGADTTITSALSRAIDQSV